MPRKITEEELAEALGEELQGFRDDIAAAMETENADEVEAQCGKVETWHKKVKASPFLMNSPAAKPLLRQATAEIAKAKLWLKANELTQAQSPQTAEPQEDMQTTILQPPNDPQSTLETTAETITTLVEPTAENGLTPSGEITPANVVPLPEAPVKRRRLL